MERDATTSSTMPPLAGGIHVVTGPNGSGKTRYLTGVADKVVEELDQGASQYRRLICLCGAVQDKFSRRIYHSSTSYGHCVYLGYRTSHNMFSEIAPYRVLFGHMVNGGRVDATACAAAAKFLADLGLSPVVEVHAATGGKKPRTYRVDFENGHVDFAQDWDSLESPRFVFTRSGSTLELRELSSGERWYILLMLAASIFLDDGSLYLVDEPENSLHPEWQLGIIKKIADVARQKGVRYTAVISTHSPLIVASAPNGTLFCDLSKEIGWQRDRMHGQTSDFVLSERFGLVSPRSPEVTEAIQTCLTLIAYGQADGAEFHEVIAKLESFNLELSPSDPLFETYSTIFRIARNG